MHAPVDGFGVPTTSRTARIATATTAITTNPGQPSSRCPPLGPRDQGPIAVSVIFRPPKIVQKFSSAKIPRSWLGSLRTIVVVSAIEILIELNCPVLRTRNLPRYGLTPTFTGELLPARPGA